MGVSSSEPSQHRSSCSDSSFSPSLSPILRWLTPTGLATATPTLALPVLTPPPTLATLPPPTLAMLLTPMLPLLMLLPPLPPLLTPSLPPYVGTPVAHGLGLPEAATYVAPPVRAVAEAPIVEQVVEPVEQWGYKVAY